MKTALKLILPLLFLLSSCAYDTIAPEPDVPDTNQVEFVKEDGADPTLEANQDRMTDNVWITRGNSGGQIFNIKVSQSYNKNNSPLDTEWAVGDKADKDNLTFTTFRNAVKPQSIVGQDLVVHLITDDIYLNVRFTSWSSSKRGGFSYIRDRVPE